MNKQEGDDDMNNTIYENMRMLITAYDKVKGRSNWAVKSDLSTLYPHSRGTMYLHFSRTEHLWESKKQGVVVLVRPIHNWADHVEHEDTEYLNANAINLMCDTMILIENIIEKNERLNNLLSLITTIDAQAEYKGMHLDMMEKIKQLKKTLGGE